MKTHNWTAFWQKKNDKYRVTHSVAFEDVARELCLNSNMLTSGVEPLSELYNQEAVDGEDRPLPIHPSAIICNMLEKMQMRQTDLAVILSMHPTMLNQLLHAKRPFTIDTALLFERVMGVPAHVLIRMQADYDLAVARRTLYTAQKQEDERQLAERLYQSELRRDYFFYRMTHKRAMQPYNLMQYEDWVFRPAKGLKPLEYDK